MQTIRLELKEIEYLRELVAEAWMYARPTKILSEKEQGKLALVLKQALTEV
jgi:hypothetical protein